jgi:hypothetical protein
VDEEHHDRRADRSPRPLEDRLVRDPAEGVTAGRRKRPQRYLQGPAQDEQRRGDEHQDLVLRHVRREQHVRQPADR